MSPLNILFYFSALFVAQAFFAIDPGSRNELTKSLAVGRTIIAIMENGQMSNGDIELPEVLHDYMKTNKIIKN